jgi:hypothetical protein
MLEKLEILICEKLPSLYGVLKSHPFKREVSHYASEPRK